MARSPLNVLVLPFRETKPGIFEYAILKRADKGLFRNIWQFISGGAEDNETTEDTMKRESFEEGGIPCDSQFYRLDTYFNVPKCHFSVTEHWPKDLYCVPNYCFAVRLQNREIIISGEHSESKWVSYEDAIKTLYFLSNKCALWELNQRLNKNDLIPV
jgi:dihydroneopterin triphosphate diphosphatase